MKYSLLISLILLIAMAVPIMASDITDATFKGDIIVTNASLPSTNVLTVFTLYTDNLINQSYIASDFSNVAIRNGSLVDTAFMPARSTTDQWCLFVDSINSSLAYTLYTGGSTPMNGKLRYFPGEAGIVTNDTPNLELANNFAIEVSGYFGLWGSQYFKDTAFSMNYHDGYIEGDIINNTMTVKDIIGTGSATDVSVWGSNWVGQVFTATSNYVCNMVQFYAQKSGNPSGNVNLEIRTVSGGLPTSTILMTGSNTAASLPTTVNIYNISLQSPINITSGNTYAVIVSIPNGNSANYGLFQRASTGTRQTSTNSGVTWNSVANSLYTRMYGENIAKSINAPISTGDHIVRVYADEVNFSIDIDGVNESSVPLSGVSVNDTTTNIVALANGPYYDYIKVWKSGILRQYLKWQNLNNFTDQSGAGNNPASTSFRTTTSNVNVTATFRNYQPIAPAVANYTSSDIIPLITATPVAPAEMYTEDNYDNVPGAAIINSALDSGNIPRSFFWYPMVFILTIIAGFIIFLLSRSLMGMSIAMGLVIAAFAFMGVVPLWLIIPFALFSFATVVKRENPGGL